MRYTPPITLRLFFYGFRAISFSLVLMVTGWIVFVPANAVERNALGAQIGTQRPEGLVTMRMARAMVHFAPDRAARMLSNATNGEISIELAGMVLRDLANGNVAAPGATTVEEPSARQVGGVRFVQVD